MVDIQSLGWDKIEFLPGNSSDKSEILAIGATSPLINLLKHPLLSEYPAVKGFRGAINALSASLKVVNVATVGGNICLALSVGTLAPIMVALDASYELCNRSGIPRIVAAKDFQIGSRQTILESGELLQRVLIPVENLKWQVDYNRFGIAASDPALAIVVGAYNQVKNSLRLVIAASVAAPKLLEFDCNVERDLNYIAALENIHFIQDARGSAVYRHEITQVLMGKCLQSLGF